jgi:Glycosyl hydrolase family 47
MSYPTGIVPTPLSRRAFLGGMAAGGAALAAGRLPVAIAAPAVTQPRLAEDVRAEFLRTYEAYLELAFPHDELRPVSGTGSDFFVPGHPFLLTTVESLDTLYVMEADRELRDGVRECRQRLDFDVDGFVQVFEVVIRMVGGLLSGHLATGDPSLLRLCRDLTDRLLPALRSRLPVRPIASSTCAPARCAVARTSWRRSGPTSPSSARSPG